MTGCSAGIYNLHVKRVQQQEIATLFVSSKIKSEGKQRKESEVGNYCWHSAVALLVAPRFFG